MHLRGDELAGFIKQRHFQEVRGMQHASYPPHLAVIEVQDEVVSDKYIAAKRRYGEDIGVQVSVHRVEAEELYSTIERLNDDEKVHGIIVQLPLPKEVDTDQILTTVMSSKDVDGLAPESDFMSPTPTAILWLLSGYNIDMTDKRPGIIGQGRLVGQPLAVMLRDSGMDPLICDEHTGDMSEMLDQADIVVTATGQPRLLKSDNIPSNSVIIDAGTSLEENALIGDVDPQAYERGDITVSPVPGGVGPLTVCALFENVLTAFKSRELV